jgi:hypothetical protein
MKLLYRVSAVIEVFRIPTYAPVDTVVQKWRDKLSNTSITGVVQRASLFCSNCNEKEKAVFGEFKVKFIGQMHIGFKYF